MTTGRNRNPYGPRDKPGVYREMITLGQLKSMANDPYILARDWAPEGACFGRRDLDFFPSYITTQYTAPLKDVCSRCVVRTECLGFALITKQGGGIWGGRTEPEREKILKKIKRAGGIRTT